MRRAALLLIVFAAGLGLAAAGCGSEKDQTAAPETVQGSVPTQTTEQETTESQATETTATTGTTETTGSESTETQTETTQTTPAAQGDPVAGKAVFTGSSGCTGCHTLADAGSTGNVGPNLDDAMPDAALVMDRVTNGRGIMPPFKSSLSAQQITDVAAYVSSVAGK